ncbi:MAG: hypothetical protein ABSC18_18490 [Verrucomicrobiota bacterium]
MKPINNCCVAILAGLLTMTASAAQTVVNFDLASITAFTDVTSQYAAQGVTFYGLTAAGAQVNIEAANDSVFGDIDAFSPPNVLSDYYGGSSANRAQTMVIVFSTPASGISFEYNPAGAAGSSTVFQAYNSSGALLGSFSDPNATGDGVWYLETIPYANVAKVEIQAPSAGWGHYIDNLTFSLGSALQLSSIKLSGTSVVLNGINGQAGATYYVLMSVNPVLPLNQWTPVATNVLSAAGNFTITVPNTVSRTIPHRYYTLEMQ